VTPERGHETQAVEQAMAAASVVVIDADVAERLPPARLEAWLARGAPLIVIAPRADGTCQPRPIRPSASASSLGSRA